MNNVTSLSEIRKIQAKLAEGNAMTAQRLAIEEKRLQTISEDMAQRTAAFEDAVQATQRAAYQQAYDFALRMAPFWLLGAARRRWAEREAQAIKWHVDRVSSLETQVEMDRIKIRIEDRLKEIANVRAEAEKNAATPAVTPDDPPKAANLILPKDDLLVPNQ